MSRLINPDLSDRPFEYAATALRRLNGQLERWLLGVCQSCSTEPNYSDVRLVIRQTDDGQVYEACRGGKPLSRLHIRININHEEG